MTNVVRHVFHIRETQRKWPKDVLSTQTTYQSVGVIIGDSLIMTMLRVARILWIAWYDIV